MIAAETVVRTPALGVVHVVGVVGSGNFHVTDALVASGARFVAAWDECGAATLADAFRRLGSDNVAVRSVYPQIQEGP
ncbi:Thiamine pyrophosphate enzyme, N-terminal TPP binding domain [Micromonospora rhizosphaerae]|uniref:Thiamine pyrophosphate enzyme, N-terminal TPP binding domain n=1 Tax=Micromonospora rhizosphaerae TaxID=568872 RepID=A0A1C6T3T5_9ACTN|nr:thiamine pyrophosphate-binding protein [Micromonospora rhizosphaerae]SCL36480.1 Thiamine pyrophosphate enzyme, N-terminal TPP binding domain [Micromonospora rhizosphaerae]